MRKAKTFAGVTDFNIKKHICIKNAKQKIKERV